MMNQPETNPPEIASARLLDVALDAAREAAAVHDAHTGAVDPAAWSEKADVDWVSHVDREAERRIVDRIRRDFPDHDFLAEEGTVARAALNGAGGPPDWLWIVDPLDGTTNYLHRYPFHAASVAVLQRGELVAGAVVAAATGEEWTAVKGGGACLNGEPIRVSAIDDMRRALIGTGFPFRVHDLIPGHLRQLDAVLRRTSGVRRGGAAAIDLCHVASGWLDGFWELVLSPWDVAAGVLMIREAGGVVTDVDGHADVLAGPSVLAGNPAIHAALGDVVRDAWAGAGAAARSAT